MKKVNTHPTKKQLSKLVNQGGKGEFFVLASAGKLAAKVMSENALTGSQIHRLGFMRGQIAVPEDFDDMNAREIERLFQAEREAHRRSQGRAIPGPIRKP